MSDDARKTLNICRKSRRYVSRFCQTHPSLPMLKSKSLKYMIPVDKGCDTLTQ